MSIYEIANAAWKKRQCHVKQDVQGPHDYNTEFLLKEEENNKEVVEKVECCGL